MTTKLPSTVPSQQSLVDAGPHEWNFSENILYHKWIWKRFPDITSLDNLTTGQTVGILVTTNGQLHLYFNGQHCKEIAVGLPVDTPLWGLASIRSSCTKIKSEILSGESCDVDYVCSYG